MQREREDHTRQPRQEVTTMVNYVGTERGSGATDTGMAAFYKAMATIFPEDA